MWIFFIRLVSRNGWGNTRMSFDIVGVSFDIIVFERKIIEKPSKNGWVSQKMVSWNLGDGTVCLFFRFPLLVRFQEKWRVLEQMEHFGDLLNKALKFNFTAPDDFFKYCWTFINQIICKTLLPEARFTNIVEYHFLVSFKYS